MAPGYFPDSRVILKSVIFVVLVNLKMADKLRIVVLQFIPVRTYNFGAVCDSLGMIPEPNGATG